MAIGRATPPVAFGPRWRHRCRVAVAIVLLHVFAALQRWVPMTKWSGVLGRPSEVPQGWRGREVDAIRVMPATVREREVTAAVAAALRRLPWEPSCLAQAATGQTLLRRRGESGVVVIGLQRHEDGSWPSHAWLLGRSGALTGGAAAVGFTPVTVFEIDGGLRAVDVAL